MKILITGGAGYIGSHACVELVKFGYNIVVVDNFSNSSKKSITNVEKIISKKIPLYSVDLRDKSSLEKVFNDHSIDGVLHFAGLKTVNESVNYPIKYYDNNISATLVLIEVMQKFNCKKIVFSSSASIYGKSNKVPIKENDNLIPINPYGRSKLMIENILKDLKSADSDWRIALLRYFNPVGAHSSGLIGESPIKTPSNLLPIVSQVAVGNLKFLKIYGNDYKTDDGTGVRDYIHVVDLVKGHIEALEALKKYKEILTVNLGTGKGYSVLDVVKAFEKVSNNKIPYKILERRIGDSDISYADISLAYEKLGWKPEYDIYQMCEDIWRWQKQNPNGYN